MQGANIKKYLRVWRNGRRACLRGKWETVWVQVPLPAPKQHQTGVVFLLYFCLFLGLFYDSIYLGDKYEKET